MLAAWLIQHGSPVLIGLAMVLYAIGMLFLLVCRGIGLYLNPAALEWHDRCVRGGESRNPADVVDRAHADAGPEEVL